MAEEDIKKLWRPLWILERLFSGEGPASIQNICSDILVC